MDNQQLQDVKQANASFYEALNQFFTGDITLMKQVWSHAEDATYMGPTGNFQIGWPAILKEWQEVAAMKLGGRVEPADMHYNVSENMAIASGYEKGENVNAQGEKEIVSMRTTNIYRKENGLWKMIGHHTDLLPFLS